MGDRRNDRTDGRFQAPTHGNDNIAQLMEACKTGNYAFARIPPHNNTPPVPPINQTGMPQNVYTPPMPAFYPSVGNNTGSLNSTIAAGPTVQGQHFSPGNYGGYGANSPMHGQPPTMRMHAGQYPYQVHNDPPRVNPGYSRLQPLTENPNSGTTSDGLAARSSDQKGMLFGTSGKGLQAPVNRVAVIIQGHFTEADMNMVRECLKRMGFQDPVIVWEKDGQITQQSAERLIADLGRGLSPGSNLLLIAVALAFDGIQLSDNFLADKLYKPIANYNKDMTQKRNREMKQCKGKVFDGRGYEGITLHVVLDGVKGSLLPFALSFSVSEGKQTKGLRTTWKKIPQPRGEDHGVFSADAGRIFQICSDYQCVQYKPGSIFSAFILSNLNAAYLPYNVLAYRILDMVNHRFPDLDDSDRIRRKQKEADYAARMAEEIVLMPMQALALIATNKYVEISQKRAQDMLDTMRGGGDTVFCSANRFDPNLSIALNWNDAMIPFPQNQS